MKILVVGANQRTAEVAVRERLALAPSELTAALAELRRLYPRSEFVLLSTCNRTEIYAAHPSEHPPDEEALRDWLAGRSGLTRAQITACTVHRENRQAVHHLLRVGAGLDSMVLGEPQILGQVKRAYEAAQAAGTVGPLLHKVFQEALGVAKRVRHQSGIDAGRVSVAGVAVDFARQIFENFHDKVVVSIGAGEMTKLMLQHLLELRPAATWLTNRTTANAQRLAELLSLPAAAGGVRPFEDLDELLVQADIVLTSTGSREPILHAQRLRPIVRRRRYRPVFIVDIALPRNVEPAVGALRNVYLYNLDDLQAVVSRTHTQRADLADQCEAELAQAADHCMAQLQQRTIGQLVHRLQQQLHQLGRQEQERTLRKLAAAGPDDLPRLLEEHDHRLINKILHLPLSELNRADSASRLGFYAAALQRLFGLEEPAEPPPAPAPHEPQGQTTKPPMPTPDHE